MGYLVLFWFVCFIFQWIHPLPSPPPLQRTGGQASRGREIFLDPLTVPEKILLGHPLNINQLSEKELEFLPGVGPSVAKRIVQYRQEHGPFQNIASLLNIKGIGKKTLARFSSFF